MLETLKKIGLEDKKAKIYLAALELGETTIVEISRKTSIKRTTAYENINDMVDLGYIRVTTKGKRRHYVAIDPHDLKELIRKKESLIDQILPDLISINNVSDVKPKVWFYHGKAGILEAYEDILNYPNIEVVGWASGEVLKMFNWKEVERYVAKRQRKKILETLIMTGDKEAQAFIESASHQLRKLKVIDAEEYPFKIEINIYANRVALFSVRDKMAVIMESEPISSAMRMIFKMCWNGIK
jgi:HTH-type transcriptional regulator, sugar sensing transcriptional regulator